MRILSFDTSTSILHVALLVNRDVVAATELPPSSTNRSDVASQLIPGVAEILEQAGWNKHELNAIVVGQGPGSFTGIRVAVITARTLAQTLKLPLIGVSYLDTLASVAGAPVAVVLAAGVTRPVYYGAGYDKREQDPAFAVAAPRFLTTEEVGEYLAQLPRWVVSEPARETIAVVAAANAVEPLPVIKNIAAAQAQLAYDRLSLKASWDSPWQDVYPLYLQSPSITVKPDAGHRDQKSQTRRP